MVARDTHATREADFRMAEFFIDRASRKLGFGRSAVRLILDRYAGRWEISEYTRISVAVQFWRKVVAAYTRGDYRERTGNGESASTSLRCGHARNPEIAVRRCGC